MMRVHRVVVALLMAVVALAAPVHAQNDLSGEWIPVQEEDNTGNTELGDWVGIPMNEASRLRSAAWDASIQTLPEWQCRPHGSPIEPGDEIVATVQGIGSMRVAVRAGAAQTMAAGTAAAAHV
jgi:hypothetical protein